VDGRDTADVDLSIDTLAALHPDDFTEDFFRVRIASPKLTFPLRASPNARPSSFVQLHVLNNAHADERRASSASDDSHVLSSLVKIPGLHLVCSHSSSNQN
jgi:hypothetical protein